MSVLHCEEHKTSYTCGVAKLVIGSEVANMLDVYVTYIWPTSESDLLFLTKTGSSYKDYIHNFKNIAEKYQLFTPPTATMAQKLTSTEAVKHLDECDIRHLAKHMGLSWYLFVIL